jgi:hypothetical protein
MSLQVRSLDAHRFLINDEGKSISPTLPLRSEGCFPNEEVADVER